LRKREREEAVMRRIVAAPVLAAVLALAAVGALAGSLSPAVPKASAYVLSNGCDEYDPARGITYRCTPDRSTFYTPDGVDPNRVYVGAGYSAIKNLGEFTINDTLGIPPPAPFNPSRDYCSEPWFAWSPFESGWQRACYNHDVCYGSQLGRKYCDVTFWKEASAYCKSFSWYNPARYYCLSDARIWYQGIVWFGANHYKPRLTSFEP
jgi:hypothetical protein